MPRRERWSVIGAILEVLEREPAGSRRITTLADKANVAHDRMRTYLAEMHAIGLVEIEPVIRPTALGLEFLERYRRWKSTLEENGLVGTRD